MTDPKQDEDVTYPWDKPIGLFRCLLLAFGGFFGGIAVILLFRWLVSA